MKSEFHAVVFLYTGIKARRKRSFAVCGVRVACSGKSGLGLRGS